MKCEFWNDNGPPFCTLTEDDECILIREPERGPKPAMKCEFWNDNGPPYCTLTEDDECPYPDRGGCYEGEDETIPYTPEGEPIR